MPIVCATLGITTGHDNGKLCPFYDWECDELWSGQQMQSRVTGVCTLDLSENSSTNVTKISFQAGDSTGGKVIKAGTRFIIRKKMNTL